MEKKNSPNTIKSKIFYKSNPQTKTEAANQRKKTQKLDT